MSIAKIVNSFNASNLVFGEHLKSLLNNVVENNTSIRVIDSETKKIYLVTPDDLMPKGYRVTGVCPVEKDSEHPAARFTFAVFGTYGFVTNSDDPFEILKEVEALKSEFEGVTEIQFSKGIEIKVAKDLVKLVKKTLVRNENKIRALISENEVEFIQEKTEKKLKTLKKDENFFISSEKEDHYAIVIDGTFCKAVLKASEEFLSNTIEVAIAVKTAVKSLIVTANKARDDVQRVIKSIKK